MLTQCHRLVIMVPVMKDSIRDVHNDGFGQSTVYLPCFGHLRHAENKHKCGYSVFLDIICASMYNPTILSCFVFFVKYNLVVPVLDQMAIQTFSWSFFPSQEPQFVLS